MPPLRELFRYLFTAEDGRACPPHALAGPAKAALWAGIAVLAGIGLGRLCG
jgi:hypothetical protein